jgi:hypothetical protein
LDRNRLAWWLERTHGFRLLLFLALALIVRLGLYQHLPIFMTQDSGPYLLAGADTLQGEGLFADSLGDWRLPGYPLFLALTWPLTHFNSQLIVLMQIGLGLGAVLLGVVIGRLLQSRLVSEALVLFLGLDPVYLLNEHTIMSESLFLVEMLAVSSLVLLCLRGLVGFLEGLALGVVTAICLLTRSNSFFFVCRC